MTVCGECRDAKRDARFCSCCGRTLATPKVGGRLQWVGSVALLVTSIWTGIAGGFGMYSRQVGVMRAWTALAVAFAAVESGKLFKPHVLHHPAHPHHPLVVKVPAAPAAVSSAPASGASAAQSSAAALH